MMSIYFADMHIIAIAIAFIILSILIVLFMWMRLKRNEKLEGERTHCDFNKEPEVQDVGAAECKVTPTGPIRPPSAQFNGTCGGGSTICEKENGAADINKLLYEETMGLDLSYAVEDHSAPSLEFGAQGYTFVERTTEDHFNELEHEHY